MISTEAQIKNLQRLVKFATSPTAGHCNFGAMVLLSPPGDVSFLAPIAPELRGVEIVSAGPSRDDGRDYDIWKRSSHRMKMLKNDLTATEVVIWLQTQCQHTEAEFMRHGQAWLESVMQFYAIPKRGV